MRNRILSYALLFETFVAAAVVYIPPLNVVFNTRPAPVMYVCCGLPYFMFIFLYDELRKVHAVPGGAQRRRLAPALPVAPPGRARLSSPVGRALQLRMRKKPKGWVEQNTYW